MAADALDQEAEEGSALMSNPENGGVCFWCHGDCGGTCLGVTGSTQMKTQDPAYGMLKDGHTSTQLVYRANCYICTDPEFAQMGLPLCRPCPQCTGDKTDGLKGHIPADDYTCDDCGYILVAEAPTAEDLS